MKALLKRRIDKACLWNDNGVNPETKKNTGGYRLDKKTALKKILPKNITERKLKAWCKRLGIKREEL